MQQSTPHNPRSLWILPHRDQSGEEQTVENGLRCKLTDALSVTELPKEIVLGVPEEVLRQYPGDDIVFAQLSRQRNRSIFCMSVPCGQDTGGRTVYLTLLQVLPPKTEPQLVLNDEGLPDEERLCIQRLKRRLAARDDPWAQMVHQMLAVARKRPTTRSFANVRLRHAIHLPQWMPEGWQRWAMRLLPIAALLAAGVLILLSR